MTSIDGLLETIQKRCLTELIENTNATRDNYTNLEIVFVLGPIGAGKTAFLKRHTWLHLVPVVIDDYVKLILKQLPSEVAEKLLQEQTAQDTLYKASRWIGEEYTNWLLDQKLSMLCEGTGSNPDLLGFLERLQQMEYQITLHLLETPWVICCERVIKRNQTTERKISHKAVHSTNVMFWNQLPKLISLAHEAYHHTKYQMINIKSLVIRQFPSRFSGKLISPLEEYVVDEQPLTDVTPTEAFQRGGTLTKVMMNWWRTQAEVPGSIVRVNVLKAPLHPGTVDGYNTIRTHFVGPFSGQTAVWEQQVLNFFWFSPGLCFQRCSSQWLEKKTEMVEGDELERAVEEWVDSEETMKFDVAIKPWSLVEIRNNNLYRWVPELIESSKWWCCIHIQVFPKDYPGLSEDK